MRTGYAGWVDLELTAEEKLVTDAVAESLTDSFNEAFPNHKDGLTVTFGKASLTISSEEHRSGAFHMLADGNPFYTIEITGGSMMDPSNPATFYMFSLAQITGNGSISMSTPMRSDIEFRGDLLTETSLLKQQSDAVIKHVKKELPGPR